MHRHIRRLTGIINATHNNITSHVLGLLLIDGLRKFMLLMPGNDAGEPVVPIVHAYLKTGTKHDGGSRGRIVACQTELLDAGLEEYAKL